MMSIDMTRQQLWQRAAQRALASDLTSDLVRRGNAVLVPSTTTDGKRYRVRLVGNRVGQCDCPAALAGKPCKHRCAVAIRRIYGSWGLGYGAQRVCEDCFWENHRRTVEANPGRVQGIAGNYYLWVGADAAAGGAR